MDNATSDLSPRDLHTRDLHTRESSSRDLLLENLAQFIGREIGVSSWQTLDQRRIDQFADATGDHQWIHCDVERARCESPYGTTVAHGFLLLSLLAPTSFEVFIKPAGIPTALNYGIDRLRFIAPVPAGARVRNHIELLSMEHRGDGRTLIKTENTFEVEGQSKPALIAQALTMAVC